MAFIDPHPGMIRYIEMLRSTIGRTNRGPISRFAMIDSGICPEI
jgi:hypothetical protein